MDLVKEEDKVSSVIYVYINSLWDLSIYLFIWENDNTGRPDYPITLQHPFSSDSLPPWCSLSVSQQWAHSVRRCKHHPVFPAGRNESGYVLVINFQCDCFPLKCTRSERCLNKDTAHHTSSFSPLSMSLHCCIGCPKSTLFIGILISPMMSCLEKRSKSKTCSTKVFPPSSAYGI